MTFFCCYHAGHFADVSRVPHLSDAEPGVYTRVHGAPVHGAQHGLTPVTTPPCVCLSKPLGGVTPCHLGAPVERPSIRPAGSHALVGPSPGPCLGPCHERSPAPLPAGWSGVLARWLPQSRTASRFRPPVPCRPLTGTRGRPDG